MSDRLDISSLEPWQRQLMVALLQLAPRLDEGSSELIERVAQSQAEICDRQKRRRLVPLPD